MSDLIVVTEATYLSDYILRLTFSDDLVADVDFSEWINRYPFFAPLRDIQYFKNFVVDTWTVSWPNGADIAPETLHQIAVEQNLHQTI